MKIIPEQTTTRIVEYSGLRIKVDTGALYFFFSVCLFLPLLFINWA